MFDKYKANDITKLYLDKYRQLVKIWELKDLPDNIKDEDLQLNSLLNIYIEPTNRCNFNCVFCARDNMTRTYDMMDLPLFQQIIDNIPKGSYITLTGHGEPTLNVHIYEMITYAAQKKMFVSLITNGSTLNKANREKLIQSGISRIQLSFQSLDKNTNDSLMGGIFERDLLNILSLIYEVRQAKRNIYLSISRVNIEESDAYADVTKKFWQQLPIDNYYEGELLSLQTESGMFHIQSKDYYLPCATPWIDVHVNADGSVPACLQDWNNRYLLGNVKDNSLMDILNSAEALKFRKALLLGDWEYLERIGYSGCRACNCWHEEAKGCIRDVFNENIPIRIGLVIDEIAGRRPGNVEFLKKAISMLESGETDFIHTLMQED